MNRPTISLLTDFGSTDHYVGAMKGVMLGICPDAQLVDVTHQIQPYKILEAAFTLAQAWRCFPAGSVHLVVVDPGVGSARRALVSAAGEHFFVAPDNGVLTMVWDAAGTSDIREITAERFFRHPVSRTFHGRDLFAPVAAHLAGGTALAEFGNEIADPVMLDLGRPMEAGPGIWSGRILRVDRFGNVVTNFAAEALAEVRQATFELMVGWHAITRYRTDYAASPAGELFLIEGSAGYLEISANQASAAALLGVAGGEAVKLRLVRP